MVLIDSNILTPGQRYTFTHNRGEFLDFSSDDAVLRDIRPQLAEWGEVVSLENPFGSSRFIIVVVPKKRYSLAEWRGFFEYAFNMIGYDSTIFIQAEGGSVSSNTGGLSGVVSNVTGSISEAAAGGIGSVLRPFAPYLIIAAAVLLYFEYGRGRK